MNVLPKFMVFTTTIQYMLLPQIQIILTHFNRYCVAKIPDKLILQTISNGADLLG